MLESSVPAVRRFDAATVAGAERLRRRMQGAFVAVIVAFVGVGLAMSASVFGIERAASQILRAYGQSVRLLLRIRGDREAIGRLAGEFVHRGTPADVDARLREAGARLGEEEGHFEAVLRPEQSGPWREIQASHGRFRGLVASAVDAKRGGRDAEASDLLDRAVAAGLQTDDAYAVLVRSDTRAAQSIAGALDRLLAVLAALNALAVFLGALAAAVLFRQSLRTLREHSEEVRGRLEDLGLFAGRLVHDLRQPLHALSIAVGTAERAVSEPRIREVLGRGQTIIRQMNEMAEHLLTFSSSGPSADAGARTAVAEVVRDLVEDFRREGTAIEWEIALDSPAAVAMEPGTLRMVARNLLDNAVKYSDGASPRRIGVALEGGAARVTLVVRDSGPGIPADALPHVFEPFFRASNAVAGHGLGLATVARLVESHGGHVEARSEVGRGAELRVVLPAVR